MSESSIAVPHHPDRTTGLASGRARYLFVGVVLGLVLGALGVAIAISTIDVVRTAIAERAPHAPAVEYPRRELPPEWRWQPKGLEYEHMYRTHEKPRLDWIRKRSAP